MPPAPPAGGCDAGTPLRVPASSFSLLVFVALGKGLHSNASQCGYKRSFLLAPGYKTAEPARSPQGDDDASADDIGRVRGRGVGAGGAGVSWYGKAAWPRGGPSRTCNTGRDLRGGYFSHPLCPPVPKRLRHQPFNNKALSTQERNCGDFCPDRKRQTFVLRRRLCHGRGKEELCPGAYSSLGRSFSFERHSVVKRFGVKCNRNHQIRLLWRHE